MGSPSIPSNYTVNMNLGGGLSIHPDPMFITTTMVGDPNKPLSTLMMGDPNRPLATLLTGDPNKPIAATFEMLNMPRLTLNDLKDLMTPKIRVQMPNYEQLCLKIFGIEIVSLCLSGEFQMITQPYVPNRFERCEGDDCCDDDRRPFPANTPTHKSDQG